MDSAERKAYTTEYGEEGTWSPVPELVNAVLLDVISEYLPFLSGTVTDENRGRLWSRGAHFIQVRPQDLPEGAPVLDPAHTVHGSIAFGLAAEDEKEDEWVAYLSVIPYTEANMRTALDTDAATPVRSSPQDLDSLSDIESFSIWFAPFAPDSFAEDGPELYVVTRRTGPDGSDEEATTATLIAYPANWPPSPEDGALHRLWRLLEEISVHTLADLSE